MKKINIKNKILSVFAITVIACFGLAFQIQAQGESLLNINFQNGNNEPLFTEINFLPGDAVTRYVDVSNLSATTQAVVVKTDTVFDSHGLAEWMVIKIDDDTDENTAPIYQSTLEEFFDLPSLHLGDLLPGTGTTTYYFFVELDINTPDAMQEVGLSFNIVVGEGTLESFGAETDFDSNSSGDSFVYNNLLITNVQVVPGFDSAVITWDTNKDSTSRVVYDINSYPDLVGTFAPNYAYDYSSALFDAPANTAGVISHSVTLTGLIPSTIYYFRPISSASPDTAGGELKFTTDNSTQEVPKLTIEKTAQTNMLNSSGWQVYNVIVRNNGQGTAYGVQLEDDLPGGALFAEDQSDKKSWQLGDIAPGEFKSLAYAINNSEEIETGEDNGEIKVLAYNHQPLSYFSEPRASQKSIVGDLGGLSNVFVLVLVVLLFSLSLSVLAFLYRKI